MGNFFEEPNLHANLQIRNMRYMILFYSSSQSFPYIIQINISALEKESRMVLMVLWFLYVEPHCNLFLANVRCRHISSHK
jgi:hypothetical protein